MTELFEPDLNRGGSGSSRGNPAQIWTGDFNALTKEDYSPAFWDEVSRIRENNRWELPQTDLTREVKGYGFIDTWAHVGQPPPIKTCRFDTRIDYIYATPNLVNDETSPFRLVSVKHIQDDASDHNMVMAEFSPR